MFKKKLTVKFNDTGTIKDKNGNKLSVPKMVTNINNFFKLSWYEKIVNSAFIFSAIGMKYGVHQNILSLIYIFKTMFRFKRKKKLI